MFKDLIFLYFCAIKPFWKYLVCFNNLFLIHFIVPMEKSDKKQVKKRIEGEREEKKSGANEVRNPKVPEEIYHQ